VRARSECLSVGIRGLALAIAALAVTPTWAQTGALDSRSLYISASLKWERPQRPGHPSQKSAFGRILAIEPDGSLATISCYLYKTPHNRLHIIYPEGFSMSSGTWKKADGHLAVRFRSIHSNVPKRGAPNEQYIEELWDYAPPRTGDRLAAWIKIGTSRYLPLQDLSDINQLAEIIQFYRKEAEARR